MKKSLTIILGMVLTATTIFAADSKGEKQALKIDTKASKVHWTGKKVTGEHTGYVSIDKGEVHVLNGELTGAAVEMDLNSIVVTDIENEEWNQKLVGHLKSDDFFSVDKYPIANFKINSIEPADNGKHAVKGDLTIKGQTHEISFPADVNVNNDIVTAKGSATIDRTKWNIQYGSGKFFQGLGDKMIYDNFEITFDITTSPMTQQVSAD